MSKYSVYTGQFKCQECNSDVTSLRHYPEDSLLTWMCKDKHMSKVSLKPKNKKDHERKIRE